MRAGQEILKQTLIGVFTFGLPVLPVVHNR